MEEEEGSFFVLFQKKNSYLLFSVFDRLGQLRYAVVWWVIYGENS
jgi:hypothetical protein